MIYIDPIVNPVISGIANKKPEDAPAVFAKFFSGLIGAMITIATIWVIFQLLQGGIEWISSGGDKTGLENARNRIINALIGLFIVFASWTIYLVILQFLGISPIGAGGGFQLKLPSLI